LISQIIINQSEISNPDNGQTSPDPLVDQGWVFIGTYNFSVSVPPYNYVALVNATTQGDPTPVYVAADTIAFVPAAISSLVTLHDQIDHASSVYITSQNFEPLLNANDSEVADDFSVPAAVTSWQVQTVEVAGYNNPANSTVVNSVTVRFYTNASGSPGSLIASETTAPYLGSSTGNFVINLASPVTLSPGAYWVSVQANLNYQPGYRQWLWRERTLQTGNVAMMRKPDPVAGPCPNWEPIGVCIGGASHEPDVLFRLIGEVVN
jgi:hypothetical protein